MIGLSLTLFAVRAWDLRNQTTFGLLSREMALLANSVLLLVAMSAVLLGTLYPLIYEVMYNNKLSVGPPYFNRVFVPLMVPVFLLMAVGPFIRWRQHQISELVAKFKRPVVLSVIFATASLLLLPGKITLMAWFALLMSFWVLTSCYTLLQHRLRHSQNLLQGLRRIPRGWYGMVVAHIGMVITLIGIALSSIYSLEEDVHLEPGDSRQMGDYLFEFISVDKQAGPNYVADVGTVKVYQQEKHILSLRPEKRFYPVRKNVMTEASIDSNLFRDVYVSLGELRDEQTGAWSVRLYYKPFILWIWLGGFVMVTGGLLAVSDKRYRIQVKQERIELGNQNVAAG